MNNYINREATEKDFKQEIYYKNHFLVKSGILESREIYPSLDNLINVISSYIEYENEDNYEFRYYLDKSLYPIFLKDASTFEIFNYFSEECTSIAINFIMKIQKTTEYDNSPIFFEPSRRKVSRNDSSEESLEELSEESLEELLEESSEELEEVEELGKNLTIREHLKKNNIIYVPYLNALLLLNYNYLTNVNKIKLTPYSFKKTLTKLKKFLISYYRSQLLSNKNIYIPYHKILHETDNSDNLHYRRYDDDLYDHDDEKKERRIYLPINNTFNKKALFDEIQQLLKFNNSIGLNNTYRLLFKPNEIKEVNPSILNKKIYVESLNFPKLYYMMIYDGLIDSLIFNKEKEEL